MSDDKKGVSPIATGVAGAVIGAAAAAAAVMLADEKNRKKAEGILKDLQKKGDTVLKEVTRKALGLLEKADKALPKKEAKKLPVGKKGKK